MELGNGFRFCGHVVRKFINGQGTFAVVTLDVPTDRGTTSKLEVRAFAGAALNEIQKLRDGAKVQITGKVDMEVLKNKDKAEVKVDGRAVWIAKHTAKTVTVEASSVAPSMEAAHPAGDKIPEGW